MIARTIGLWLESLLHDFRFALRMLRKAPGFTIVVILTLTLGIGANAAIFSLLDAVLLRTLPIERPEELERLGGYFSYPLFRELRTRNEVFSGLAARQTVPVSVSAAGRTERAVAEIVSGNYFEVLGVRAMLGRTFTSADDRVPMGHPVAVISYHEWRQRLSGDPAIVGKQLRIDNYPFTVIGVAPPAFFGVEAGTSVDMWLPVMMQPQVFGRGQSSFDNSGWGWLNLFGRRAPGVGEARAREALNLTFHQIVEEGHQKLFRPGSDVAIQLASGSTGFSRLRGEFENPLYVLMAVVVVVLLIAAANVANLLLARSTARRHEVGIRLALGAGRSRLIRQFLVESTLLGIAGGCLGFLVTGWAVQLLLSSLPAERVPLTLDFHADARLLCFTLTISLAASVLLGLAPAIRATRPDVNHSLTGSKLLVVSQVSLSLVLLIGAGLFLRSLRNVVAIDAGLNTEGVLLASLDPELNGYAPLQVVNFYRQLRARLLELPGVRAVGMSEAAVLSGEFSSVGLIVPGNPRPGGPARGILQNRVDGDFFQATGGAIVRGRDFGAQDTPTSPKAAIISERAARYFFGEIDPLGARVRLGGVDNVTIIGIARDSKYRSVREEPSRISYVSFQQDERPSGERTIYVRTDGEPLALAGALRRTVQALDRDLPLYNIKTFAEQKDESLARERLVATLSGFFGALALSLASIGLYGVMAYNVQRRTREIGIRMSLGAARGVVMWGVAREGLMLLLAGVVIGLPLSWSLSKLLTSQLYGVAPGDPVTVLAATLLLAAVAACAGYLPARRASSVDPMLALRTD
jgi:predicted permease